MSKVVKMQFDDGFKEIEINGDKNRVIRFNTNDVNILDRFTDLEQWISPGGELEKMFDELRSKNNGDFTTYNKGTMTKLGNEVNKKIDEVFGEGTSATVFANVNPISPMSNGGLLFTNFIEALAPLIKESFDKAYEVNSSYVTKANKNRKQIRG